MHDKHAESKGLRILMFPCNQFGSQEPGTEAEIKAYAATYTAKHTPAFEFDMFSKINVNGGGAHPLYNFLKAKQKGTLGDFIKWNFTKFLIDKNGVPIKRYAPNVEPQTIEKELHKYW